jgi:glycine/D-amino acid oxidase-like deaminating enzyme
MTTATLFNQSYGPDTGRTAPLGPPPLRRVVIVGGGTAGWMTALLFARSLAERGVEITLLESPQVGIIGVGEGSTPWLRGFFDSLAIEEAEWMPACHATYKCGISFDGWSTKPGFERYFHPFASMLDNLTMRQFVHNADTRVNGVEVHAHPDRFFIATHIASGCRAPKPAASFPFDVWHGYHFDAVLLGQFLHKKALERGVRYHSCHVSHAELREDGSIAAVATREGERIAADLFVDCSGFAALLIEQALHTPYVSFASNLFNDAAVAMPTPIGEAIPSQTFSTALQNGWVWKIPLTDRYGNGYVYSSRYCSAEQAERELRTHLGLLDADVPARHLKMKTGRVSEAWNRNCLAIGLAGGFIEPLEATALFFIQHTVSMFLEYLERGDLSPAAHRAYNERVNAHFEGIRDYIVTHFKANSRQDTQYWRDNAANMSLSDDLKKLFALWMSGKGIAPMVAQQQLGKGYPVFSWYAILAGMGIFPDREQLRPPSAEEGRYRMEQIDDLLGRSSANYPDHRAALGAIAPRRSGPSLQAYFF